MCICPTSSFLIFFLYIHREGGHRAVGGGGSHGIRPIAVIRHPRFSRTTTPTKHTAPHASTRATNTLTWVNRRYRIAELAGGKAMTKLVVMLIVAAGGGPIVIQGWNSMTACEAAKGPVEAFYK